MMPLEKSVARPSPTPQRLGDEARNAAAAAAPAAAVEVSRVDVHETSAVQILNAMNENIRSLGEVDFLAYGVPRPSHLVSLSLHSNRLSSLEGFASLTALTSLNLSSNDLDGGAIRSCAPHLGGLSSLESLDLSCNRIDTLLGLPFLPRLSRLLVPYNRLESLNGVQVRCAPFFSHASVEDGAGRFVRFHNVQVSGVWSAGEERRRPNNPLCSCRGYRRDVIAAAARSLQTLDGRPADDAGAPDDVPGGPGSAEGAATATMLLAAAARAPRPPPPEEVPVMPRFDALAGRFRRLRVAREDNTDDVSVESYIDIDRAENNGAVRHHPEETAARADAVEEQGLLSRLRSVAQEARLEVMDSRLQDLHVRAVRMHARSMTAARAVHLEKWGVANSARRPGVIDSGAGGTLRAGDPRRNPWAHQQGAQPGATVRRVVSRNVRSSGSTGGPRSGGDRHARLANDAFQDATVAASFAPSFDGAVPRSTCCEGEPAAERAESGTADCPCYGVRGSPEVKLGVAGGGGMQGAACCCGGRHPEIPPAKLLSDASTQATRGPGATTFRSTGIARTRRPAAAAIAATGPGLVGKLASFASCRFEGALVALILLLDGRRVKGLVREVTKFSVVWIVGEVRTVTRLLRGENNVLLVASTLMRCGPLSMLLYTSFPFRADDLYVSREAKARKLVPLVSDRASKRQPKLRSVSAACRVAEEEASALKRRLEEAESEIAAAVAKQQQAQAEASRARADAEASLAAIDARAAAATERLEEQLRGKARAESDAEEESRRVRALLREAESRVRGLQDQVEESRARERRAAADADDARRRAAMDADKKLAAAVDSERDRIVAGLEFQGVGPAGEEAKECGLMRTRRSTRGWMESTVLPAAIVRGDFDSSNRYEEPAALQVARGDISAARAERIVSQEAAEAMRAEAARTVAEVEKLRGVLEAREAELTAERQARRQNRNDLQAAEARAEALSGEKEKAEAKVAAASAAEEDLRTALMVKDKVLEDREKLVKELRLREGDALSEAQGWRDRLESQQADAEHRLDAAREEARFLAHGLSFVVDAQVVALSGVEDQLREVFKELRRSVQRDRAYFDAGHRHESGTPSRDGKGRRRERDSATELTAVAAVTAAAKAVEEELRGQLEAKDEALRRVFFFFGRRAYVENELLGMKSLFEDKEACLRRELSEERDRLAREVGELKQELEQAEAGRAAAEENVRQQELATGALHASLRNANHRSKELEETLRALLLKHTSQMAATEATSRKLSKMAALFQQLQDQDSGASTAVEVLANSHDPSTSLPNRSCSGGGPHG
ncbi:unnamed protein product [Scytosiphon promiscuus]